MAQATGLAALKAASSLGDLATLLGFQPKAVSFLLFKVAPTVKYRTFQIPKRSGGQRTITAPFEPLCLLQRRLSVLLQDCADEIVAATGRKDRSAHGFKRHRSIVTNARQHRHRRHVFNIDLEDFFPSINFGRVRGFFIHNRDFALHDKVATTIAQIACNGNVLPQGSPCSPVISNLIAGILDIRLVRLAASAGWTYSRYADDLTFSTNKRDVSPDIAVSEVDVASGKTIWRPGAKLSDSIARGGFAINSKKTRLLYRTSRQDVTGLVVNSQIGVRLEYRQNVRAMVHRLVTKGEFELLASSTLNGQQVLQKRPGRIDELHGMLGFIYGIDQYVRETKSASAPSQARTDTYQDFLLYSLFYAAARPTILCEGETDNVYLTHAIRGLATRFPELAEVLPDGEIKLKVRLYKYPRTSTAQILGLDGGGSSVLARFMGTYKKRIAHFTAPGLRNPVVIVYDNDSGAAPMKSVIAQHTKSKVTGSEAFVPFYQNLYAVPTPLGSATSTMIEDFFEPSLLNAAINGRTFNPDPNADSSSYYNKTFFAHQVVARNASTINFNGFVPLLTNIVAAIKAHQP